MNKAPEKQYTAIVLCDRELENKTIERCAQWLEDNYPSARTIALEMRRALKDTL